MPFPTLWVTATYGASWVPGILNWQGRVPHPSCRRALVDVRTRPLSSSSTGLNLGGLISTISLNVTYDAARSIHRSLPDLSCYDGRCTNVKRTRLFGQESSRGRRRESRMGSWISLVFAEFDPEKFRTLITNGYCMRRRCGDRQWRRSQNSLNHCRCLSRYAKRVMDYKYWCTSIFCR